MYFKVLGLRDHDDGAESEPHNIDFIWKGVLILVGLYVFFLVEVALHELGDYLKKVRKKDRVCYHS